MTLRVRLDPLTSIFIVEIPPPPSSPFTTYLSLGSYRLLDTIPPFLPHPFQQGNRKAIRTASLFVTLLHLSAGARVGLVMLDLANAKTVSAVRALRREGESPEGEGGLTSCRRGHLRRISRWGVGKVPPLPSLVADSVVARRIEYNIITN